MDKINIFDVSLTHVHNSNGDFSATAGKIPSFFRYTIGNDNWNGITVFVDEDVKNAKNIKSKYKIGWLLETREFKPHLYNLFSDYKNDFDFVMTHDKILLESFPNKTRKIPFGGSWISKDNFGVHHKTKNVSMIYSFKSFMQGHILRHKIAETYKDHINLFGTGSTHTIERKEEGIKEYRFSVVIENSITDNYFTEKLIDVFAMGTIPVFCGCPNINEFFNINGIISFNNVGDFNNILPLLTEEIYLNRLCYIKENFELCKEYEIVEDWLYKNIYKELL